MTNLLLLPSSHTSNRKRRSPMQTAGQPSGWRSCRRRCAERSTPGRRTAGSMSTLWQVGPCTSRAAPAAWHAGGGRGRRRWDRCAARSVPVRAFLRCSAERAAGGCGGALRRAATAAGCRRHSSRVQPQQGLGPHRAGGWLSYHRRMLMLATLWPAEVAACGKARPSVYRLCQRQARASLTVQRCTYGSFDAIACDVQLEADRNRKVRSGTTGANAPE